MIDLDTVFDQTNKTLNESKKTDLYEIDRVCTTFADVRDTLREAAKDAIQITPLENCVNAYVTMKDGDFTVSPDIPGKAEFTPIKQAKASSWKIPAKQRPMFDASLKDIDATLRGMSDDTSSVWGNGRSCLKCVLAAPPEGSEKEYGGKFLAVFPEILQFDAGGNRIEGRPDGADDLLSRMKECPCCAQTCKTCVDALKRAQKCKEKLESIEGKLEKMTDGFGWRCSLDQYVDDKYSRHIVNAAMKHGIDVSRDSQFVKSLARRLAEIATQGKPTKSDLATYAKCDKIDFKSDACRQFLADVETNAEETNKDVLGPIRDFTACLAKAAMNMALAIAQLDGTNDVRDLDKCKVLSEDDAAPGRKTLESVMKYCGRGPKTKIIGCNGKLYLMTANFDGINAIVNLFGI